MVRTNGKRKRPSKQSPPAQEPGLTLESLELETLEIKVSIDFLSSMGAAMQDVEAAVWETSRFPLRGTDCTVEGVQVQVIQAGMVPGQEQLGPFKAQRSLYKKLQDILNNQCDRV